MPWGEIAGMVDAYIADGLHFTSAIRAVCDELDLAFHECLTRYEQERGTDD